MQWKVLGLIALAVVGGCDQKSTPPEKPLPRSAIEAIIAECLKVGGRPVVWKDETVVDCRSASIVRGGA